MQPSSLEFKSNNLLRKKFSFLAVIVSALISGFAVYFFFPKPTEKIVVSAPATDCAYRMNQLRLKDFKLTHPLLLVDLPSQNPELNNLKDKINRIIATGKSANTITDISVYYRKLNDGSWFEINGNKEYNPASLMKVPLLITILKQAGSNPKLLDKKVFFGKHFEGNYNQNIKDFHLQENKQYSIRELLQYMIQYSDNDAMSMIAQNIDATVYNKLFTDFGISVPPSLFSSKGIEYFLNIIDYSKFFRLLYNSGYLNDDQSELALEFLTKSTYKEGILRNINSSIPVAHKFGERILNNESQLHEVGIFYVDQHPYLLGIMSSGHDMKQLSGVLSEISKVTFDESGKSN